MVSETAVSVETDGTVKYTLSAANTSEDDKNYAYAPTVVPAPPTRFLVHEDKAGLRRRAAERRRSFADQATEAGVAVAALFGASPELAKVARAATSFAGYLPIKSEIDPKKYPTATFELSGLDEVVKRDDGAFNVKARGLLRYRGREVELEIAGTGTMDEAGIDAKGEFDLDLRDLGMKPPRFLMFKMEPELTVEVFLRARA